MVSESLLGDLSFPEKSGHLQVILDTFLIGKTEVLGGCPGCRAANMTEIGSEETIIISRYYGFVLGGLLLTRPATKLTQH